MLVFSSGNKKSKYVRINKVRFLFYFECELKNQEKKYFECELSETYAQTNYKPTLDILYVASLSRFHQKRIYRLTLGDSWFCIVFGVTMR